LSCFSSFNSRRTCVPRCTGPRISLPSLLDCFSGAWW